MKTSHLVMAGVAALMMSGPLHAAGQAPAGERSNVQAAEQFIEDSVITAEVKGRFAGDDQVSALAISVETQNGEVQLSGFSTSPAEKARAEEIALSVDGVKAVRNDIVVRAGG
ncbi:MAG: BON domain-containing protein [Pigmentiphaga sp.]|nr:BON domain-containing protein [Pigmentiphaga sp.]